MWHARNFAALANRLTVEPHLQVLFTDGPGDENIFSEIKKYYSPVCENIGCITASRTIGTDLRSSRSTFQTYCDLRHLCRGGEKDDWISGLVRRIYGFLIGRLITPAVNLIKLSGKTYPVIHAT